MTSQWKKEDQIYCQQVYFFYTLNKWKISLKIPLISLMEIKYYNPTKKSRIQETLTLLTDGYSITIALVNKIKIERVQEFFILEINTKKKEFAVSIFLGGGE